MPSPKQDRMLPHRNRKHNLRPVPQPKPPTRPHDPVTMVLPALTPSTAGPTTGIARPSEPFPFLKLPGEIRNKIYDLVVPEACVVISGNHPQKELHQLKLQQPLGRHKLPRYRLFGSFTSSTSATATSLLFTCRQMNREAVEFIYARTTFCFNRIVTLRKFLNVIPRVGRSSIESLEIIHVGYGEPQWVDDRQWKLRHDMGWKMILERVKDQVTALRNMKLEITCFDWPCRLETTERWARPLLSLAGDGLDRVSVTLAHDRFHSRKAASTARELENKMMTAAGRKGKRNEMKPQAELEKKRKEESQRKAIKVLTIRLPDGNGAKSTPPVKKVVRKKGLEQYVVWEPPVAYC